MLYVNKLDIDCGNLPINAFKIKSFNDYMNHVIVFLAFNTNFKLQREVWKVHCQF